MLAQFLRRNASRLPVPVLRFLGNYWSPFRGAGIRIKHIAPDFRLIIVEMKLRWFNRNYVGTHFGGSLYAMTDPFYMMMLINILGRDYIVWDKGAKIDFIKPGRRTVQVRFEMTESEIEDIRTRADKMGKYIFDKQVNIIDEKGVLVATVIKTLYVRRKTDS